MRWLWRTNLFIKSVMLSVILVASSGYALAETVDVTEEISIDRIHLVTQQIHLLKNRFLQAQQDLARLQKQHDTQFSQVAIGNASKRLLDKGSLEIAVDQSKRESIEIEIADAQQSISWLEKNIQEIENQLNLLGMFGLKVSKSELVDVAAMRSDLKYKQKLFLLEKERLQYLRNLQVVESNALQLKIQSHDRLNTLIKSNQLLNIKQQQVKDELAYQELQNTWLQKMDALRAHLMKMDPSKHNDEFLAIERDIYVTNQNANHAYIQSLIARYRDQIQQMKLAAMRSNNSVGVLNEISDQVVALSKQVARLDSVIEVRAITLEKHVKYLERKKPANSATRAYIDRLLSLVEEYRRSDEALNTLTKSLAVFRGSLDKSLQVELSSRQGFPSFGVKSLLDLGKEMLLVPTLTYNVVKSLSNNLLKGIQVTGLLGWVLFAIAELVVLSSFVWIKRWVRVALMKPSEWRNKINTKWLTLQWLDHNFIEFAVVGNMIGIMYFFDVPLKNYLFIVYLAFVWMMFKSIMTLARVCLVETPHSASGHDVKLYNRLKWLIIVGGVITALTVFAHQLPLIYELKALFDRLFLFFLMLVSLLLLRSWDFVPNMILSRVDASHPYLQKSIRLIGFIIPLLIFINSLIGVFGYVNLVMTVSGYEGIFLIVLIAYLIMRGLLSDSIEQLSRLLIQYSNNGWLWSEAFLKPFDKVLRVALFLLSCAVLFLLYGWDKQSTIVVRFNNLLQYKLFNFLNTDITPWGVIELFVVFAIFYWSTRWSREFVYRLLRTRMRDIGLRNSIAILTQYCVVVLGLFISLQVLGIDLRALTFIVTALAFGVGLGLRDLVNNFACGFLILFERPLRVGDIIEVSGTEGEVSNIGSRAVTIKTWDNMDLVIPNADIFNKPFTNLTYKDNVVRCLLYIKIGRRDDPHAVSALIMNVLHKNKDVLKDPVPEVLLKSMGEIVMEFELRYFVNIRLVKSRIGVSSALLMNIWDEFGKHGIEPPYPKQEITIEGYKPA